MCEILTDTWCKFCTHFDIAIEISEKWLNLIKITYEAGTFYNINLLELKLKHFLDCSHLLSESFVVYAGIIFQSIYHDAQSFENFEKCQSKFQEFATESNLVEKEPEFVSKIKELIELSITNSTEEHNIEGGFGELDKHYFIDIDFVHLAVDWEEYIVFSENARKEYNFLSESAYKSLRLKVLQRFLLIPNVFATQEFRTKFEIKARENIAVEIESLK